ncbi:unnamed protein product [Ectocarpus sp. 8 AP-2014]
MAGNTAADQQQQQQQLLLQQLLLQAKAGNARGVKATVAAGASVNGSPTHGRPLIAAAYRGHVSIVKFLAKRGAQLEAAASNADQRDEQGNIRFPMCSTALHAAVYGVHVEAVRALLQAGANPNSMDVRGWTPLDVACTMFRAAPRYAIAKELLTAGADPAKVNFDGRLAIHCAASRGDLVVIQMLLAKAPETINHFGMNGLTPLGDAAREGHPDAVSFLLANGASDKEAMVQRGVCALMVAAQKGHSRVVRLLLDHGLEVVGGVAAVSEAMKYATQLEHPRILWMLLGAEGSQRRQHWATLPLRNWPPLYHAATVGSYCSAKVLLAAGRTPRRFPPSEKRSRRSSARPCPPAARTRSRWRP